MSVPIRWLIADVLFITSDLITGKSIPVLVGIVRLPIDQFLAGLVLSMGAVAGVFFTFYSSRAAKGMHQWSHANRLLQLFFALFLSLSLLLSLSRGVHYMRGVVLSIVPAFCVAAQSLPARESTALVAMLVSLVAYWCCMGTPVQASEDLDANLLPQQQVPFILRGLNAGAPEDEMIGGVWDVLLRTLLLFVLAFYACVQHAPTEVYCAAKKDRHAVYASSFHAQYPRYALFVGLTSALIRVCVWYGVCFFPNNVMHVMLENDLSRGGWPWACCILYSVALLFSACWTATQLREQVLPFFRVSSIGVRVKLLVCALSLATLFRQRDSQLLFTLTGSLAVTSLLATAATLRDPD